MATNRSSSSTRSTASGACPINTSRRFSETRSSASVGGTRLSVSAIHCFAAAHPPRPSAPLQNEARSVPASPVSVNLLFEQGQLPALFDRIKIGIGDFGGQTEPDGCRSSARAARSLWRASAADPSRLNTSTSQANAPPTRIQTIARVTIGPIPQHAGLEVNLGQAGRPGLAGECIGLIEPGQAPHDIKIVVQCSVDECIQLGILKRRPPILIDGC
jgi:hypothetical protein